MYGNRFMGARAVILGFVALGGAATGTPAQTRSLRSDLGNLNVRLRTDHYAISGTIGDDRLAEYGRALEYIHKEYAAGFARLITRRNEQLGGSDELADLGRRAKGAAPRSADHIERTPYTKPPENDGPAAPDRRFKVVVLSTGAEYQEFTQPYFGGRAEHTRGLFVPGAQLLIIRDEPASHETYEILFHEAFHQFVDRYIPAAPTWINEGLATYYGTARPTANGLVFDRPRTTFFDVVSSAADARQLIPLEELMQAAPNAFYARTPIKGLNFDRSTLHYAQSYTLVAYMLRDEAGRAHLGEYLRGLANARSPKDAHRVTRKSFPDSLLDATVKGWVEMVRRY